MNFSQEKEKINTPLTQLTWKYKKELNDGSFTQSEIKLVDMTEDELRNAKTFCNTMLYNNDKEFPGRYLVLDAVIGQRMRCNIELCLRELERSENRITRYQLISKIQNVLKENNITTTKSLVFSQIANVGAEYADIPLNLVMEGCIGRLGVFNRKYLKLSFILKQGVCLTSQELNELTEKENDIVRNRLDVIKERLNIDPNIKLFRSDKGLTYMQLRALLQLKNKKYSEMSIEQLSILRNRILFLLEKEIKTHITQWETRIKQIEEVAALKNYTL